MTDTAVRAMRKVRTGTVVSDKMDKSIIVRIDRTIRHSTYSKIIRTSTKLYAHDEKNEAKTGDKVKLMEARPLSKTKRWRLVEIVEQAK